MSLAAPWNAGWTGEERYEVRPCRWAEGRLALWQPHAPGEGRPIFAKPHVVRQRRAVAKMLCTVCGEPTAEGDRWMFPLGDWRKVQGRSQWLTTETPVHRRCCDLALKVCPRLRAAGFEPFPFPLHWTVSASLIAGEAVERDFGVRIPPENPIIGALKLGLSDHFVRTYVLPQVTGSDQA